MDIRTALDGFLPYIPDDGSRAALREVGAQVSVFVGQVDELARQVESLRIDVLALTRRVERLDGASGR